MNQHEMIDSKVTQCLQRVEQVSVTQLLRTNNVKLLFAELDEDTGGFTVTNNRCHTFAINQDYSDQMQVFVILHELGHLKLHKGVSTPFYRSISLGSVIPKIEREANEFAVKMLYQIYPDMDIFGFITELELPDCFIDYL